MPVNIPVQNGNVINDLCRLIHNGTFGLQEVPVLVIRVIQNKMWDNFLLNGDDHEVNFPSFEAFVTSPMPEGLGTTIATLKDLCRSNPEAIVSINNAVRKKRGQPKKQKPAEDVTSSTSDVVNETDEGSKVLEQELEDIGSIRYNVSNTSDVLKGNSRDEGLRKLEQDRPDLLQEVLSGEKTVNAAAIEAGHRHVTFTIKADDPYGASKSIAKRYKGNMLQQLIAALQDRFNEEQ